MVVHEDSVSPPLETAVGTKPVLNRKTYDNVKNLVKELSKSSQNTRNNSADENKPQFKSDSRSKSRKTMSQKSSSKHEHSSTSAAESDEDIQTKSKQIDESDLNELKSVYFKCKEVMTKIEKKYGHLLDLDTASTRRNRKRKANYGDEDSDYECQCVSNKKIIFDDDGRQLPVDTVAEKHICPKKLKKTSNIPDADRKAVAIEYNETEIQLPDDLQELEGILRDTYLETTYRNKVIEKMKSLKQDYANEIKFNRHSLIEKLKTNPEELIDFKGSNLSSLPGYCSKD